MKKTAVILILFLSFLACKNENSKTTEIEVKTKVDSAENKNPLIYPEEKYYKSIRQVTFGGDNADA